MIYSDISLSVLERQNIIIKEQSSIINDLFQLLSQYMTMDELDNLPQVRRINELARQE